MNDDGRIVFAGEPIVKESPTVPFAWGCRLDGESLYVGKSFGWMELGFQESYFVELLIRKGWFINSHHYSTVSAKASWYVAKKIRKIRPDIPIIVTSGYGDEIDLDGLANSELIAKPFLLYSLSAAVHKQLSK